MANFEFNGDRFSNILKIVGSVFSAIIIVFIIYASYTFFYQRGIVNKVNNVTTTEHKLTREEISAKIDSIQSYLDRRFDRLDASHVDRDSQAVLLYHEINDNQRLLEDIIRHQYRN